MRRPLRRARSTSQVDHEGRALLVGLHHEADAVPARQLRRRSRAPPARSSERSSRSASSASMLRPMSYRWPARASASTRGSSSRHHPLALRAAVARVQRRELDRDAGAVVDAAPGRGLADGVDRVLVGGEVARGVGRRSPPPRPACRRNSGSPCASSAARVRQRLVDGLAGHELLAHHPHGEVDALADHRLAAAADQARQRRRQAAPRCWSAISLPVTHQAPGRGVDEQRRAVAEMRAPVAVADLVADQRVARRAVGDAQQRLGQAHQRHALLGGERVFVHQRLDPARPLLLARSASPAGAPGRVRRGLRLGGRVAAASRGGRHSGSGRR